MEKKYCVLKDKVGCKIRGEFNQDELENLIAKGFEIIDEVKK